MASYALYSVVNCLESPSIEKLPQQCCCTILLIEYFNNDDVPRCRIDLCILCIRFLPVSQIIKSREKCNQFSQKCNQMLWMWVQNMHKVSVIFDTSLLWLFANIQGVWSWTASWMVFLETGSFGEDQPRNRQWCYKLQPDTDKTKHKFGRGDFSTVFRETTVHTIYILAMDAKCLSS